MLNALRRFFRHPYLPRNPRPQCAPTQMQVLYTRNGTNWPITSAAQFEALERLHDHMDELDEADKRWELENLDPGRDYIIDYRSGCGVYYDAITHKRVGGEGFFGEVIAYPPGAPIPTPQDKADDAAT